MVSRYRDELCRAMLMLAEQPKAIFLGQTVVAGGSAIGATLADVPLVQRVELPVFENTQCGLCTGLAIQGWLPICIFPRIDFLMCAMDQLVLHLDKIPLYSAYRPRVIIRTAIASDKPLDPGPQHTGNYLHPISAMLSTVRCVRLTSAEMIVPEYEAAMKREQSTLLCEELARYDD